jgi:hypothetical protein
VSAGPAVAPERRREARIRWNHGLDPRKLALQ